MKTRDPTDKTGQLWRNSDPIVQTGNTNIRSKVEREVQKIPSARVIVIAKLGYGLEGLPASSSRIIIGQFSAKSWTADLIVYNRDGCPLLAFKADCSLPE